MWQKFSTIIEEITSIRILNLSRILRDLSKISIKLESSDSTNLITTIIKPSLTTSSGIHLNSYYSNTNHRQVLTKVRNPLPTHKIHICAQLKRYLVSIIANNWVNQKVGNARTQVHSHSPQRSILAL
jgi:hypothetical protein